MDKKITLLEITIKLFYFIAFFWLMYSLIWLFRDSVYSIFYFVNGLILAIILITIGRHLRDRKTWVYRVTLVVLIINILLTITDQMGWFDFIYLIPAIGLLVLVIIQRKIFVK